MTDYHPAFSALTLRHRDITLHLITEENLATLIEAVSHNAGDEELPDELRENYAPAYDDDGRRTRYGFYATLKEELVGFSLLDVDSWTDMRASTGADTLFAHRGKGVAPGSKPHLYYVAFHLLGLNRVDTGCLVSNTASRRSLEKTPGVVYEGLAREFEWNPDTEQFEDVYLFGTLRRDWETLYNKDEIEVLEAVAVE